MSGIEVSVHPLAYCCFLYHATGTHPRAYLGRHHGLMGSVGDGIEYESLGNVLVVAMAAFSKLNQSLSRWGYDQSASG